MRERKGYAETDVPFAEFQWADFFRTRVKIESAAGGFERAVAAALKLAGSPKAKNLPGYMVL